MNLLALIMLAIQINNKINKWENLIIIAMKKHMIQDKWKIQ